LGSILGITILNQQYPVKQEQDQKIPLLKVTAIMLLLPFYLLIRRYIDYPAGIFMHNMQNCLVSNVAIYIATGYKAKNIY